MAEQKKLPIGVRKLGTRERFLTLGTGLVDNTGIEIGVVDPETRRVTISFSSEAPVPCEIDGESYNEILSHSPGAPNLQRINGSGNLLFNHDMNDLLGVVEKAWLGNDRRCYCTVRFSTDERGEWAMQRVIERVLQSVSFKYRVHAAEMYVGQTDLVATSWTALEVSFVTVPGDASVGTNRSAADDEMDVTISCPNLNTASAENSEGTEMSFKTKHVKQDAAEAATSTAGGAAVVSVPVANPAAIEAARVTEIQEMCRTHSISDDVRNHLINLKAPIEQARGIVLNQVLAKSNGQAVLGNSSNPDLTEKEKASYSLVRAISACVNERMGESNAWKSAGFEREVSQAIGQRSGKTSAGIFMPTNLTFYSGSRAADYSVGTGAGLSATSGGSNIVATNLLAGSFIDMLRNKARVFGLGAQMLSGLTGNVDIPRQKSAGQVYWIGEGGTIPQTGAQFDKVSLNPKHLGALSVITRNMLQQTTPYIEQLVRADMIQTMALGIDSAALSGTGASGQPLGIANQAGIGSVIGGTNGAALTLDHLIDLETQITSANADEGAMAYLTNAKAVGALKKLKSTTGQYLWTNSPMGQRSNTPGEINGYSVARTNQARSDLTKGTGTNLSEIYFGDWSQLLVGEWGVVEILPNPYSPIAYETGGIELRVLQTIDIAVRHAQSFATMSDAIA